MSSPSATDASPEVNEAVERACLAQFGPEWVRVSKHSNGHVLSDSVRRGLIAAQVLHHPGAEIDEQAVERACLAQFGAEWGGSPNSHNRRILANSVRQGLVAAQRTQKSGGMEASEGVDVANKLVEALIDISEHGIEGDDRDFTAEGHRACVQMAYDAIRQNEWFFGGRPREAALDAGVADGGPWHVGRDGKDIFNNDFTVDAALRLSGDFRDDEHRMEYAKRLCRTLNAANEANND